MKWWLFMPMKIIDVRSQKEIEKPIEEIVWEEIEEEMKYPHFMIKEILEQPEAILRALNQDDKDLLEAAFEILRAKHVVFSACGTSRYAAIIGRYLFSKIARKFSEVIMASEFQYFSDSIDENTVVIAVSQSGETADVLEGVERAKKKGAKIIAITNVRGSTLSRLADKVFYINCGPEICVAATKSFTAQLAVMYLLAYALINKVDEGRKKLIEIAEKIRETIDQNHELIKKVARQIKDKDDAYFIARGIDFAIACEGALKLKELSYIHAEGMPAGELKHGTLSLIEDGIPVITICPNDYTHYETLTNALEAKSRGAFIIGVSDKHNEIFDVHLKIPDVEEIFYPIVTIVPIQLLAYYTSVYRGLNPDKPRHLAKSVVVK